MESYKMHHIAGYRKFAMEQARTWQEEMNEEDCEMNCAAIAAEWEQKAGFTDEEIMEEVDSLLSGRMYTDGFGAWTDKFGTYGNDEITMDIVELDTKRYSLDVARAFDGEFCGCKDPETGLTTTECGCPRPTGYYVARIWDDKKDKEVRGSRFHHLDLDTACANAIAKVM